MVVDTSAFIAILLGEAEASQFAEILERAMPRVCSSVTYLEASIVIEARRGAGGLALLDLLIAEARIEILPFASSDARSSRRAFRRFGKGLHPAGLDFGDCVAYALASDRGETLLYKGEDFAKTDIIAAA